MLKKLLKWRTKNFAMIPLFTITFNYQKFIKDGAEGSCDIHYHPIFNEDKVLRQMLFNVIDYIRSNYDMKKFTEI